MTIPEQLCETILQRSSQPSSVAVGKLIEACKARYGEAIQGILFYGSCFHKKEDLNGLFDLYIIVDDYASVNHNRFHATLNKLLPPNVFYLEVPFEGQTIRAKYAILSLSDLKKSTSKKWFHSYIWARFCQPTLIAYSRDDLVKKQISAAFSQAVLTFVNRTLPCMSHQFTIRDLWQKGLELTYRAELRPEKATKQVRLFDTDPEYFTEITGNVLDALDYSVQPCLEQDKQSYTVNIPKLIQYRSRATWALRIAQGKLLSILRLIKATLTFKGGIDYVLWKIHRHTGVTVEASPRLRRYPMLAAIVLSLRLYKQGGFK